jgi:histidyl-tRNA synthetase
VSPAKFQAPRGTHDVLPSEHLWWHVVRTMEEQAAAYGWRRIQTPGFEDTGLFTRTSGEASDVVNKEMYTFTDRSDRSLTLRPEGTAPIARAYVEHGLHREPQPVKAYTIAPMYRYGAPGRGRYREHWQLSLEAIGSPGPEIDAEVIQFYVELLRRLGVTDWELRLNSIGDANCRPQYVERLNAWLDEHKDVLDEDARHKRETSPLQVFDVKSQQLRAALDDAPKIGDSLCEECRVHFDALKRLLDAVAVPYLVDPVLVRGLDYYTRTTFEFVGPEENVNSTICGGGRYDGLVELLGGPPTKGIGFAIGEDRLILSLEEAGKIPAAAGRDVYIAWMGEHAHATAIRAAKDLRNAGFSVELPPVEQKFGKALERASKLNSRYALILGDNEVAEGSWTLKTLADGMQQRFTEPELLDFLKRHQ